MAIFFKSYTLFKTCLMNIKKKNENYIFYLCFFFKMSYILNWYYKQKIIMPCILNNNYDSFIFVQLFFYKDE